MVLCFLNCVYEDVLGWIFLFIFIFFNCFFLVRFILGDYKLMLIFFLVVIVDFVGFNKFDCILSLNSLFEEECWKFIV